jgi:hypothetical protein
MRKGPVLVRGGFLFSVFSPPASSIGIRQPRDLHIPDFYPVLCYLCWRFPKPAPAQKAKKGPPQTDANNIPVLYLVFMSARVRGRRRSGGREETRDSHTNVRRSTHEDSYSFFGVVAAGEDHDVRPAFVHVCLLITKSYAFLSSSFAWSPLTPTFPPPLPPHPPLLESRDDAKPRPSFIIMAPYFNLPLLLRMLLPLLLLVAVLRLPTSSGAVAVVEDHHPWVQDR